MTTLARGISCALLLIVLGGADEVSAAPRGAPFPFASMDVVAVEPARSEFHYSCVHPREVELPRMTVVWRQGRTGRWAIAYFPKTEVVSPYGSRSSRFYCDDHVEFLWDDFDFGDCERWHPRLRPLAPTRNHRLVHIFKGDDDTMEAVFCSKPTNCTVVDTWLDGGRVTELYAYDLDYAWE